MKLLIFSLFLIAIVVFTSCTQEPVSGPVSEEKGSDAGDEMIEVEIFDSILFQKKLNLERTYERITGETDLSDDQAKEESTARMIIRVGDYDWELTEGNHYKALKDGDDYFNIEGNPLKHSWGGVSQPSILRVQGQLRGTLIARRSDKQKSIQNGCLLAGRY